MKPVFVVEIAGRAVVAFNEADLSEAQHLWRVGLQQELLGLAAGDGSPVWDGKTSVILRDASPEEHARWWASQMRALRACVLENQADLWICFLIPTVDPTDE